jgi:hypothetical protein
MSALQSRWASRRHVGAAKPVAQVFVRTGLYARGFTPWSIRHGDPRRVNARIYGETGSMPWAANWRGLTPWVQLPNIAHVELTQDFENNGINVATITLDNVVMAQRQGKLGEVYHLIDRGYLSPWRGSAGPAHVPTPPRNEWYGLLVQNAQIRVYQGYGSDTMRPTFTGLLDDCDVESSPDTITLIARDFGQALTDQHVFGHVISPALPEPTIFQSLGKSDAEDGTRVGYSASASSTRPGHPARFVDDTDKDSRWISADHTIPGVTEWVQIRLPRGRYESFAIEAGHAGMEMFVGVFARNGGLHGQPCLVDEVEIENGWIDPAVLFDPAKGGMVPGGHGGWPYIYHWAHLSDKAHANTFPASLELGDDSVLRIGLRYLYKVTQGVYRADMVRLQGIRKPSLVPKVKEVALSANASSYYSSNYPVRAVLDNDRNSRWLSEDHTIPGVTEWIQIGLDKGRYQDILLDPAYDGMDCWIGVRANSLELPKGKKCMVDGREVDDGWVDLGHGDVPGANGGWPYVLSIADLQRAKSVKRLWLEHTFELGAASFIRVAFRGLKYISEDTYRAGVTTLKGLARVVTPEPKPTKKVVQCGDLSDVVKVALRWAGFKEWNIETVGAPLKGKWRFNRSDTLMDIIKKAQEHTGYVFYMAEPSDDDASIGIPTFRSNQSITDAPGDMLEIHDTDMLSDVQAKATDEPLGYIIRVRGKKDAKHGLALGAQKEKRVMAVYRPPWWATNKLARLIKHVTHDEWKLTTVSQCMVMCELIALQEALVAASAEVQIPGNPDFELNTQVALVDTGSGLNTRLFIARRSSTFESVAGTWATTLGGALIDTDDIRGVVADLRATLRSMGLNPQQINLGDPFGSQ